MGDPQFAPGDPVLVAAVVQSVSPAVRDVVVRVPHPGGSVTPISVPESDVHPVPPTPDPRDQAIAAVRALHSLRQEEPYEGYEPQPECEGCGVDVHEEPVAWPCATIRALDGVAPVPAPPAERCPEAWPVDGEDVANVWYRCGKPLGHLGDHDDATRVDPPGFAPPAPTPTGWTAAQVDAAAQAMHDRMEATPWARRTEPFRDLWRRFAREALNATQGVLALRAEEAAAAAPATTDDATTVDGERVERAARRLAHWGGRSDVTREDRDRALTILADDDAHRATRSSS